MYLHNRYWWQPEPGQCKTHGDWIEKNYPTKESCINKCNEAVKLMIDYFNDLTVQVGYANGTYHCWCKDEDGNVVDPTAKKFDGDIKYSLIAEGAIYLDT